MLDRCLREGVAEVPEAPAALVRLFEQLDHVPVWVDWDRIDRAGSLLFRTVVAGGIVLGARSLALGYRSPGGNKPLVFSGRLSGEDQRMRRRLGETGRFVVEVCRQGGMRRHATGFASTVRVRWMHAHVRRLIRTSGRWHATQWGEPINQHDMAATTLLFSLAFVDGVRAFGFHVTPDELDDYLHLWRYNGYVMGVEPELLAAGETEARRIADCIEATQAAPDEDSRTLVRALIEVPLLSATNATERRAAERRILIAHALVRGLLGDRMADELDLPVTSRVLWPTVRTAVSAMELGGRRIPGYRDRMVQAGQRYWMKVAASERATELFAPPTELYGLPNR